MNLCKISISSQVTTVTLKHTTVYLKSAPGGSRLRQQRNRGGGALAVPRSCGWVVLWMVKLGEMATVSHDFLQSLLSLEPLHHGALVLTPTTFEQEMNPVGEKLWNKRNNKTRIAAKLGLSLCTVTNAHHHCYKLFCLMRNYLSFFVPLFLIFCQNQTCCLSCVCCTCDSWESEREETDKQKMPALLTARAPTSMTESASTWQHCPPVFFHLSFFFSSLLYNHLFHCKRHSRVAEACCNYKAVRSCGWKKLAFSSTVCVFGTRWINKVVALVFLSSRFIDDVSVDATARPGSHVGSQCHDVIMKFFGTSNLHMSKNKKKKETWNKYSKYKLQVGFDALMCLMGKKKSKRKIKLLKSPGFHFEISLFAIDECTDSAEMVVHKNQSDGQNCVIFSYFQKSLIVIVTLWKTLMLYYDDLFYIT